MRHVYEGGRVTGSRQEGVQKPVKIRALRTVRTMAGDGGAIPSAEAIQTLWGQIKWGPMVKPFYLYKIGTLPQNNFIWRR